MISDNHAATWSLYACAKPQELKMDIDVVGVEQHGAVNVLRLLR